LQLSLEELDFGEKTLVQLSQIEEEGGFEQSAKLKAAFQVLHG
jgi:hypothetical protein